MPRPGCQPAWPAAAIPPSRPAAADFLNCLFRHPTISCNCCSNPTAAHRTPHLAPQLDALLVAPAAAAAPPGGDGGQQPQPQPGEVPAGALVAVLVCVAVVGVCDGLCQGALFGEAAQLPPPYTQVAGSAGGRECGRECGTKHMWEGTDSMRRQPDGLRSVSAAEGSRSVWGKLLCVVRSLLAYTCTRV